jgi:hypothetical protein
MVGSSGNDLRQPCKFYKAFAVGETPAPARSEGERGEGKNPPLQKPYKTEGESMLKEDLTM